MPDHTPPPAPTLEEIANGEVHAIVSRAITKVLARNLIALREAVEILVETSDEHCHRLDALESPAAPADREPMSDRDLAAPYLRLIEQRDAARTDAQRAREERDGLRMALDERNEMLAERTGALEKYGRHLGNCKRNGNYYRPCDCGFLAALAPTIEGA